MNKKFNQRVYDVLMEGLTTGRSVSHTMRRVGRAIKGVEQEKDQALSQGLMPKDSVTAKKEQANRINRKLAARKHSSQRPLDPRFGTDTPEKRKNRGSQAYYQGKADAT